MSTGDYRLLVHVEGESEERFVQMVLKPHLLNRGYSIVNARMFGPNKERRYRGGIPSWNVARKTILAHLKNDTGSIATTMVDYYGLPKAGRAAWPGGLTNKDLNAGDHIDLIEDQVRDDINRGLGTLSYPPRFIPYVVMHEFEALLFSDCKTFAQSVSRTADSATKLSREMENILSKHNGDPEAIDDSPHTAPSKHIDRLVPNYAKAFDGPIAAVAISLDFIRQKCLRFNRWITQLEEIAAN